MESKTNEQDIDLDIKQLACNYINTTTRNLFLTGKAGTGKTTFLQELSKRSSKRFVILAPTGVAAIRAGGVTLHSFFQLPFTPFIPTPEGKQKLIQENKLRKERRSLIRELDLVVIDEISMVRCDVLDAIDMLMKHIRRNHQEPFGGVQVLCIGDLYQLPPVVLNEERHLLQQFYPNPYFFSSHVLSENPPLVLEFTHVYRQQDPVFIDLLNKVRENKMCRQTMEQLNAHLEKDFSLEKFPDHIILCTHNVQADQINQKQLEKLTTPIKEYTANISGHFPENQYPNDEKLLLKKGAKIMFLKNDTEQPRRYFNGKIGVLHDMDDHSLYVKDDDGNIITVGRDTWQNLRYHLNQKGALTTEVAGSFTHFPIRLAWAVTIHKSQGLTFDQVAIDAADAFASGQTYVALSRCKTIEGLVLLSPIDENAVKTDVRVEEYYSNRKTVASLTSQWFDDKKNYEENLLVELYDFSKVIAELSKLYRWTEENTEKSLEPFQSFFEQLQTGLKPLETVGKQFGNILSKLTQTQDNSFRQKRLNDADGFFSDKMNGLCRFINEIAIKTDNKSHAKRIEDGLDVIFHSLRLKQMLIHAAGKDFSIENHLTLKNNYAISSAISVYGATITKSEAITYGDLYRELVSVRNELSFQTKQPIYMIASTESLRQMADCLPKKPSELLNIKGFGEKKTQKYGGEFLSAILTFVEANPEAVPVNVEQWNWASKTVIKQKKLSLPKEKGRTTHEESLFLFENGKTIDEIAQQRNLHPKTIENHLAFFVEKGVLDVSLLVSETVKEQICAIMQEKQLITKKQVKENLNEAISYREILFVFAWKTAMQKEFSTQITTP